MKTDISMLAVLVILLLSSAFTVPELPTDSEAETRAATPAKAAGLTTSNRSKPAIPIAELPDFNAYQDVRAKKQAFFNFMLPMIREANERITADRAALLAMRERIVRGHSLNKADNRRLDDLRGRYRIPRGGAPTHDIDRLLLRVDVVPESLVLAQAANESGWGTSRFARQANNMFGVWCFTKGCGLTPLYRDEGLTHEVARYETVQDSIAAYIHNINTHRAYRELRAIRASSRSNARHIRGLALAEGLEKYSERGEDYVREIQQMIRVNNLQQYTTLTQQA